MPRRRRSNNHKQHRKTTSNSSYFYCSSNSNNNNSEGSALQDRVDQDDDYIALESQDEFDTLSKPTKRPPNRRSSRKKPEYRSVTPRGGFFCNKTAAEDVVSMTSSISTHPREIMTPSTTQDSCQTPKTSHRIVTMPFQPRFEDPPAPPRDVLDDSFTSLAMTAPRRWQDWEQLNATTASQSTPLLEYTGDCKNSPMAAVRTVQSGLEPDGRYVGSPPVVKRVESLAAPMWARHERLEDCRFDLDPLAQSDESTNVQVAYQAARKDKKKKKKKKKKRVQLAAMPEGMPELTHVFRAPLSWAGDEDSWTEEDWSVPRQLELSPSQDVSQVSFDMEPKELEQLDPKIAAIVEHLGFLKQRSKQRSGGA